MPQIYEFHEFRLETAERRLQRNGSVIPLAPKVFDTLVLLVENQGRLLARDELMRRLWPDTFVEDVSLAQNISQIRKALGDAAGNPQIVQTVSKQGYRFVAPVRLVSGDATPETTIEPLRTDGPKVQSGQLPIARVPAWPRWLVLASLVLAGLAVAGSSYLAFGRRRSDNVPPAIRSIAVLPLANLSTDPDQEFFADGVTDDLITELAQIRALRVISRTSVMQYKGTRKTLPEIARELKVDALVEGSISQHGDRVHITAQLVQLHPEHHIWAESYDRPLAEAQNLQSEISREIAGALRANMTTEEQARMRRSRAANPEANLLYLKGRYFLNKRTLEGVREAEKCFRQSIEKDADLAVAHIGLAEAYIFEGGWGMAPATVVLPQAGAAARQALLLDPDNAEAHAALGLIAMNYEWDWPKAEREYKLALRLNPNDSVAHHWYAEYLGAEGRFDEGLAELQRAQELDPLSLAIAADRGKLLYFSRRYDESIVELRKTLELDPAYQQALFWLVRAYAEKKMWPEMDAELASVRAADGGSSSYWAMASMAAARAGKMAEARDAAAKTKSHSARPPDPSPMLFSQMALGDADQSFIWMEKCYEAHSTMLTSLKVSPDYDNLRADPRFATYLARVGLLN